MNQIYFYSTFYCKAQNKLVKGPDAKYRTFFRMALNRISRMMMRIYLLF